MQPEAQQWLSQTYDALCRPDPYPDAADETEQAAWAERVHADGWLAGLLSQAMNAGRVTRAEIDEGLALLTAGGSRLGVERAAQAYDLLLREAG